MGCVQLWTTSTYVYSENSDKGHSERGQTSQQRTSQKYSYVYTLYRKSPLKEDNLSTKDKTAGPEGVLVKRFHYSYLNTEGTVIFSSADSHDTRVCS